MTFTDIHIIRLTASLFRILIIFDCFIFCSFCDWPKTAETTVTVFLIIYLHVESVFLAVFFKVCSIYLITKKENFQTTLKRDPPKE